MIPTPPPRTLVVELCRHFHGLGWASGTGGGVSIRERGRVYIAPSGVQKERLSEEDLYVLDEAGNVLEAPRADDLRPSACTPLFFNAFRLRDAGCVIHSHAMPAMLATLVSDDVFECTELEMIKGITGHGYHDRLVVPVIENTAHEADLADSMLRAMTDHPRTFAILVRRHGVYVWGSDWIQAKTHAECYHYLFEAVVRMRELGIFVRAAESRLSSIEGGKR